MVPRYLILILLLPAGLELQAQTFSDVSAEAGISARAVDPTLMAGGVVWFDYNNDRYPDLLLTNGSETVTLYRNNWDGTFTDVSESTGLLNITHTMGAVSGDFDGDGFNDLFLTTMPGRANHLLKNQAGQGFVDVSYEAGITEVAYGSSATVGDYDGDGDLDIYVANYLAGAGAVDGGQANFLYRNDGKFIFKEVAATFLLADTGCGLGVTFADFNNDRKVDLYVANDYGYFVEPNAYFQNDFPLFAQVAGQNGTDATINAMGIAKGDYDNDGDIDLYITNIRENPLYENIDQGSAFITRGSAAGVSIPELTSWGTAFSDFDLDGRLDLVVANGQIIELNNKPEPQSYFHNSGNGSFQDASETAGIASIVTMGRGLAVADFNLDGYPDLAINAVQRNQTGTDQATLLRNEAETGGRWLAVEVPVSAVHLRLHAGDQTWHRDVDGGSSYLSHSAGPIYFGAPVTSALIDSLVVSFTNSPPQTYTDLGWNQLLGIRQDGSWYLIEHFTSNSCGDMVEEPTTNTYWQTDGTDREQLIIEREETFLFPVLAEAIITLSPGEYYRGLPRTQETMLVDTIAGEGPCPTLQPIRLKIVPTNSRPEVYPNPFFGHQINLRLPPAGGPLEVDMLTIDGKHLLKIRHTLSAEQDDLLLHLPLLPRGTYILRLIFSGVTTYHKIIRQ